ncbi:endo alpha-1,4 polygalactosaminidase [Actinoplanes sp. NPDC051494]|uniref:endo alpha-1,4 polygalactosaminidase n=1 Tax=Actinoplanes sp. NPDC051494 TaxID=3363907 RepID=UPI0037A58B3E
MRPSATSAPTKSATPVPAATTPAAATWTPPPANGTFDYQIGGAYTPPSGVTVVSRDRTANAASGLYNICYVNAFQAQPDANAWWEANHPELLLRDANGEVVIDEDWDEILLDFSTAAKRAALTTIVGGWMDGCKSKGYQAVEPDNLDSWTRSGGRLTKDQAISYANALVSYAHGKGLAVGQKNTADLSTANAKQIGFDFAVAEECADFDECENYTATYGNNVIVIEYTQSQFTKACAAFGSKLSIVLRDVDVTAPGSGSYVFKSC